MAAARSCERDRVACVTHSRVRADEWNPVCENRTARQWTASEIYGPDLYRPRYTPLQEGRCEKKRNELSSMSSNTLTSREHSCEVLETIGRIFSSRSPYLEFRSHGDLHTGCLRVGGKTRVCACGSGWTEWQTPLPFFQQLRKIFS